MTESHSIACPPSVSRASFSLVRLPGRKIAATFATWQEGLAALAETSADAQLRTARLGEPALIGGERLRPIVVDEAPTYALVDDRERVLGVTVTEGGLVLGVMAGTEDEDDIPF